MTNVGSFSKMQMTIHLASSYNFWKFVLSCLHCPSALFYHYILKIFFKTFIIFMCIGNLPVSVDYICAWYPWTPEEDFRSVELKLQMFVRHHVGARNWIIEHVSSGWAVGALKCWAISPAHNILLYIKQSLFWSLITLRNYEKKHLTLSHANECTSTVWYLECFWQTHNIQELTQQNGTLSPLASQPCTYSNTIDISHVMFYNGSPKKTMT